MHYCFGYAVPLTDITKIFKGKPLNAKGEWGEREREREGGGGGGK